MPENGRSFIGGITGKFLSSFIFICYQLHFIFIQIMIHRWPCDFSLRIMNMAIRPVNLTVSGTAISNEYAKTFSYHRDGKSQDRNLYRIPLYRMTISGRDDAGNAVQHTVRVIRFGVGWSTQTNVSYVYGLAKLQSSYIRRWLPDYSVHSARHVFKDYLIHDGADNPVREVYATAGCIDVCDDPYGFDRVNSLIIRLSGVEKALPRARQLRDIAHAGRKTITYERALRPALRLWNA
jgi:hypothetical protein